MARFIDADRFREVLVRYINAPHVKLFSNYSEGMRLAIKTCIELLDAQRAVDAVKVVRCKDCKYSGMYCFGASYEPSFACLDIEEDGFVRFATAADPDGYCSHGERKSNDHT